MISASHSRGILNYEMVDFLAAVVQFVKYFIRILRIPVDSSVSLSFLLHRILSIPLHSLSRQHLSRNLVVFKVRSLLL